MYIERINEELAAIDPILYAVEVEDFESDDQAVKVGIKGGDFFALITEDDHGYEIEDLDFGYDNRASIAFTRYYKEAIKIAAEHCLAINAEFQRESEL
jgi:hypothetical protein